ncbi:MAG: hypothetical protein FJW36_15685 [Acidobacteria bacterium]|nr:hypothetical protein [Acidobacteriota bacterium]
MQTFLTYSLSADLLRIQSLLASPIVSLGRDHKTQTQAGNSNGPLLDGLGQIHAPKQDPRSGRLSRSLSSRRYPLVELPDTTITTLLKGSQR